MQPLDTISTTDHGFRWSESNWNLVFLLALTGSLLTLTVFVLYRSLDSQRLGGILLVLFAVIAAKRIVHDFRTGLLDPWEARSAFIYFYALYVLTLPLLSFIAGVSASPNVSLEATWYALFLSTIALLCFFAGYRKSYGEVLAAKLPSRPTESHKRLYRVTIFIICAVTCWFGLFLLSIGGISQYVSSGYSGMYEIEKGREHFAFSVATFPTCVLLLYHLAHRTKRAGAWVLLGIAGVGAVALLLAIGHRRLLITMLIGLLVYRHYAVQRISAKKFIALAFLIGLTFSVIGIIRLLPERLLSRQTVSVVLEQSPPELFYAFLENGEAAPIFESFPLLIEETSHGMQYQWGRTYFLAPLILVPKVVFPDRPLTPAEEYTLDFFPEIAAKLGGRGLFFLAEAYWNFGPVGPLLVMFVIGVVCRFLYSIVTKPKWGSGGVLVYATAMSWIPSVIRIDLATSLKVSIGSSLPLVILVIWYSNGRQKTTT